MTLSSNIKQNEPASCASNAVMHLNQIVSLESTLVTRNVNRANIGTNHPIP